MNKGLCAILLAMAASACGSCHKEVAASQSTAPVPPAGEVWLTPQQVKDAKIEV
jgi:hypothetical protein